MSSHSLSTAPLSWRDDARLVMAAVGAVLIHFVVAAWAVVDTFSATLAAWSLAMASQWALTIALQVESLRLARGIAATRPRVLLQFALATLTGFACTQLTSRLIDPLSVRLGLTADLNSPSDVGAWTATLVAIFIVWQREASCRESAARTRLHEVQKAQLSSRREAVESQLRAVQARVDPQLFFDTLDAIESIYASDVARAEALFEELIAFLRFALPRLGDGPGLLIGELSLAQSCVRLHNLASGRSVELVLDVPANLARRPFPAGVILPLVRDALRAPAGRLMIRARLEAGQSGGAPKRCVALTIGGAGVALGDAVVDSTRAALQSFFGESPWVARQLNSEGGVDLIVKVPA